jgi:hypothetical protein
MLRVKIKKNIKEAQGDSKELVSINMDFLKKASPKPPEQSPRDYYQELTKKAEMGVEERFSKNILDFIEKIPSQYLPENGKKYFIKWLANVLKVEKIIPKYEDIRHVKDYFVGINSSELPATFKEAMEASDKWHEELAKTTGDTKGEYKTNDVVHSFGNGYKMVRIAHDSGDKKDVDFDLKLEGDKMGNCIGKVHCQKILSAEETIYSLRDSKNEPHVSINIFKKDNKIDEIKGRGNKPPADKYESLVVPWIIETFKPVQYFDSEGGKILKSKYFPDEAKEKIVLNTDDASRSNKETILKITGGEASPELLLKAYQKFLQKKNDEITFSIVGNKNSPFEVINDFYQKIKKGEMQPNQGIYIIKSGKATKEMLYGLFELSEKAADQIAPLYILKNQKDLPAEILKKILDSKKIKKTSDFFAAIGLRQEKFRDVPVQQLEKFGDSKLSSIRISVAQIPGISSETFKKIFDKDGGNADNRTKLLKSQSAPEEILEKYSEPGNSSWDILAVAQNKKASPNVLEKIFNQFKDKEGPPGDFIGSLNNIIDAVAEVIKNPALPMEKIKKLDPEKINNNDIKRIIKAAFEKRNQIEKEETQQQMNEAIRKQMLKIAGILKD